MDASDLKDTRFQEDESSQRSLRDGFARIGDESGLDMFESEPDEDED